MVLHGTHLEACLAEDFIGTLNLLDIVIRHAHALHPTRLQQWNQSWCPTLHVHRVVNPVDIDIVTVHTLDRGIGHLLHAVIKHLSKLRGKLG